MRLFVLSILYIIVATYSFSQVNIWDGSDCHHDVGLTPFLANGSDNVAVIVCPGGSYFWHDMQTEGYEVAKWLQKNEISAFVLRYRTAGLPAFLIHYRLLFKGNSYPDPQDDLRQAITYLCQHADDYSISPKKIGVLGFSAGGHLAMSAAELFKKSERPAFVAAIYPVVSMSDNCVHKRSRRGLLGDKKRHNQQLCDSLSLEKNIPADCPPVFLVNCKDDPIVDYHNSELLDSALTIQEVPHTYIQYQTGGHGFGVSEKRGSPECRQWKQAFLDWIKHGEWGTRN